MTATVPGAVVLPYIVRGIDRLVAVAEELSPADLRWSPVPGASSIATLVAHTVSNAEDNLLFTLAAEPGTYLRQRDFEAPPATAPELRARWAGVRSRILAAETSITGRWEEPVIHPRRGEVTRLDVLIVVARHVAEHLAQAELTAQLLPSNRRRQL